MYMYECLLLYLANAVPEHGDGDALGVGAVLLGLLADGDVGLGLGK